MEGAKIQLFKLSESKCRKYRKISKIHLSNIRIVAYYERQGTSITPAKSIRYFVTPPPEMFPIDLNVGYEEYLSTKYYSKHVDLCLNYDITDKDRPKENRTKVFTRSTTLAHIMNALYNNKSRDNMSIRVSRYNGNIYITSDPNESEKINDDDVSSIPKPIETHHNQIKRYVFADTANAIPDIKKPWNEKIEFLGVFQCDLNKFDIIYNGSIHAIMAEEEFKEFDNLDEFNKCRFVLVKQMWKTSPHKYKKFFKYLCIAYLTKVNDIFVANKDPNGVVREPLKHKLVSKFPHFQLKQLWSSEAFLLDFLCRIEKLMSDINCLDTVYVISKDGDDFYYKKYEGKTIKSFIPQFYQDHVKNKANN